MTQDINDGISLYLFHHLLFLANLRTYASFVCSVSLNSGIWNEYSIMKGEEEPSFQLRVECVLICNAK